MGIASQLSFSTATSVRGGALGSIPYQSATSSTVFVSIGAAGTVLQSNGTAPIWAPASGTTVGTSTQVTTVQRTTNAAHFLTFVDSNNTTTTAESLYTTSSFTINPATGAVGINTTSPNQTFEVNAVSPGIRLQETSAGQKRLDLTVDSGGIATVAAPQSAQILRLSTIGTVGLTVDTSQNVHLGTGSTQLNTGFTNKLNVTGSIVAGNVSSTNGSIILQGLYGTGSITNFGTEFSSGGPVLSYGVYPSNTATGAFLSSTGLALTRGAYTIAGNAHNWYVGTTQTLPIGSTATMSLAMTLSASGALAFNGASNFGSAGQILQSNGNAPPTWVPVASATITTSTQVQTVLRTTNTSHFLAFVDSNNASATAETVYTTSSFTINPQSGNISVGGSITASTVGSTFALGIAAPSQSGSASIAHIAGGNFKIDSNRSINWDGTFPTTITGASGASGSITINAGNSGVPVQFLSQGDVHIQSTTAATSTITGALRVAGGVGIRGDLWVGGTINTLIGSTGQVNTIQRTTNAVHYLTFVDSNNATATAETIYTTSSFNINPQSGNVGIGTTSTIGFWGTNQTTARTRIDFSNASTSIDTAAPILALTNADQTVANLTSIVLGTLNGAGGNPIGQAAIYSVNATTNRAGPLGSIGFATANISGTMVERVRISEIGNLILNGNAAGAGNQLVLRGGTAASSEGPQIVMGYGNNTSSAITGQANSSWNIDIASGLANNNFRIFRQNSAGATVVGAEFTEASGGVQLISVGVGTTSSGVTGEIRATNEITAYFSSDIRLKENIRLIADPITIVNQIRGVYYDWTDEHIKARGGEDGYFVRKHDIGVIAQEVEAVLPEIVAERDDGTKVVKYEKLVALLIEAVKDQQRQINQISQALKNLAIK